VKEFGRTQWRREESIGQVGANSVPPTPTPTGSHLESPG
jgi:hypothetical protein